MVLLRCPPDQLQQKGQEVLTKFSDLVVKCLIKLTKALQSTLDVGFRIFSLWPPLRSQLPLHHSVCVFLYSSTLQHICKRLLALVDCTGLNSKHSGCAGAGSGHAHDEYP